MKSFHYKQNALIDAAASILTGQQLTENVDAFKNQGFELLNGSMDIEEIHDAINLTIKSAVSKLSNSTWNVVSDIYGKRDNGTYTGDWILQRKNGNTWLTIKDGGTFKAHDSISSVLSIFEMKDEGIEEDEDPSSSKHMMSNQLETIIRNSEECLTMIEDDRKFPEWAQSKIAVAEHGIISITEYMNSHASNNNMDEESPFKMGTATIIAPGHKLDSKKVNIFHKYDDGRINVQYSKSDKKGDVFNLTLNKNQYKLDETQLFEETVSKEILQKILRVMETEDFYQWYKNDFNDYIEGDADAKTQEEIFDDLENYMKR